jgi:hypothetical protein
VKTSTTLSHQELDDLVLLHHQLAQLIKVIEERVDALVGRTGPRIQGTKLPINHRQGVGEAEVNICMDLVDGVVASTIKRTVLAR